MVNQRASAPRVYAVDGVPPEILAYALARYSRSRKSLIEHLEAVSQAQAAQFFNTFYYAYGHASIADLAHVALAIEEISLLAAMEVVAEPLWDGQERSTRYQDFGRDGWWQPEEADPAYDGAIERLLGAYRQAAETAWQELATRHPKPPSLSVAEWERTLRARAFDRSRGFLPLAMKTALGQITSARSLERQVARLMASPFPEVRQVASAIREAATARPAWRLDGQGHAAPTGQPAVPTLLRHAEPTPYLAAVDARLTELVAEEFPGVDPPDPPVALYLPQDWELHHLAVAIYRHAQRSYGTIVEKLATWPRERLARWYAVLWEARGPHDAWPTWMQSGPLVFDLVVDVGAFRDFNRHRRLAKAVQPLHEALGWSPEAFGDPPSSVGQKVLAQHYQNLPAHPEPVRPYLLPLAHRRRLLLSMDLAEAAYLIELRTRPQGHPSYRRTAWRMFEALSARLPTVAAHIRAVPPEVEDPFTR
ncbi:MAG: FAD-dependent thymidylate synthase [Firmicutes bacterium]|nr:FAD-dependent thymidylate synthase [Alicyclobacillaceae bacterium]MCL6496330.1 FAD-dependent thymidylate synthase [Bacillota bacterium]